MEEIEKEMDEKDVEILNALRALYVLVLVIAFLVSAISIASYVVFSTYVYITYFIVSIFLVLILVPAFLIMTYLLFHELKEALSKAISRAPVTSSDEEKNSLGDYLGVLLMYMMITFFALYPSWMLVQSVGDLVFVIKPKTVVLYNAEIIQRPNVGRAILRQGQIIIGEDENGNKHEFFLGKGFQVQDDIEEIYVEYLPFHKIAQSYEILE